MREVAIDTETTGLDPYQGDRLVEIGCVELANRIPTGRVYHSYINPERTVPDASFQVHGLSTEFLRDKPKFSDLVDDFLAFIGDAPLVAHNAMFDLGFINAELERVKKPLINRDRLIDTLMLARRKHPEGPNTIERLIERYEIDTIKRSSHGALLDAELVAEIYLHLIAPPGSNPRQEIIFAKSEYLEAQARIEQARLAGATTLSLNDLRHLNRLPPEISQLSSLRSLTLGGFNHATRIDDLDPISTLTALRRLNLAKMPVVDLYPIASLRNLTILTLAETSISDLEPLRALSKLERLNIYRSRVSSLAPVANLRNLHLLDLRKTRVSDLSAIADLTELVAGAKRQGKNVGGLKYEGAPIADPILRSMATLADASRTRSVITYLRDRLGLSPLPDVDAIGRLADWEEIDNQIELFNRDAPPPRPPAQGPGPHFAVRDDGVVDFAPPESVDREGNNVARMQALHPLLRDLAKSILDALSMGNVPHSHLRERFRSYFALIDRRLEDISFSQLYAEGVRLQNAITATLDKIRENELPPLDVGVDEEVRSVLDLHGSFVMSTADGMELIAAEERYKRRPEEEEEFRSAATSFAAELRDMPQIMTADAAEFVLHAAEEINSGANRTRSSIVGSAAIRNASIVIIAGATIAAMPTAGTAFAGMTGTIFGALAALVGFEVLRNRSHLRLSQVRLQRASTQWLARISWPPCPRGGRSSLRT